MKIIVKSLQVRAITALVLELDQGVLPAHGDYLRKNPEPPAVIPGRFKLNATTQRDTCSLRTKPSVRASVSGPLGHQASRGLGTIGEGDAAVHPAQAVLANTAARTLALGDRLNSSWRKGTVISMAMEMEKPANRLGNALAT